MAFIDAVISLVQMFLASNVGAGAMTGLTIAAYADIRTFLTWQNWNGTRDFRWDIALLRWIQGFIGGALAGAGLDHLSGVP
jgi:uncharacterized membrane protein YoaK (UPF0700 family)